MQHTLAVTFSQKNYITLASKYRNLNLDLWTDLIRLYCTLIAFLQKVAKYMYILCFYGLHLSILFKAWNTMDTIHIRRFQADSVHINISRCITCTVVIWGHPKDIVKGKNFIWKIWGYLLTEGKYPQILIPITCKK